MEAFRPDPSVMVVAKVDDSVTATCLNSRVLRSQLDDAINAAGGCVQIKLHISPEIKYIWMEVLHTYYENEISE